MGWRALCDLVAFSRADGSLTWDYFEIEPQPCGPEVKAQVLRAFQLSQVANPQKRQLSLLPLIKMHDTFHQLIEFRIHVLIDSMVLILRNVSCHGTANH
jgi:hypothetical protein